MKQYVGRKQSSNNADWLYAVEHIEELISPEEVEIYAAKAAERISQACSGKKVAYAWSGGKDSIVLGDILAKLGITEGYFAYCDLDYPAFISWVKANRPAGVTMMHTGYNLEWLAKHQELIFATGHTGQRWHQISQKGPFTEMFFSHGLELLLLGHRVIDGNVCGPEGFIRKKTGEVRYNPLYDWPHEAILGYIHYHGLSLPPFYGWKDGYVQGTHAWPERDHCKTLHQGYQEVYDIDSSIIIEAARYIPSALDFLREVGV